MLKRRLSSMAKCTTQSRRAQGWYVVVPRKSVERCRGPLQRHDQPNPPLQHRIGCDRFITFLSKHPRVFFIFKSFRSSDDRDSYCDSLQQWRWRQQRQQRPRQPRQLLRQQWWEGIVFTHIQDQTTNTMFSNRTLLPYNHCFCIASKSVHPRTPIQGTFGDVRRHWCQHE